MKKFFYNIMIMAVGVLALASCAEDEGQAPGNDSAVNVMAYAYAAELPYDTDADCKLRICVNNKAQECYYLAEKTADFEARIEELGEEGYNDYVLANGTKVEVSADADADVILEQLYYDWTITVVAVGGKAKVARRVNFTGSKWNTLATGTYKAGLAGMVDDPIERPTTLQQSDSDPKVYRFKDIWGAGQHVQLKYAGKFGNGHIAFTMARTATPYSYGSYGTIYMTDYATYQGDSGFLGYNEMNPETSEISVLVMYYVSADYLGYSFDEFVPDAE